MMPRGENSAMRHCARVTRKTLVQRIAAASSAVIDHIDSGFPNLSSAERRALHDALDMLISLQDMANRDLSESQ